MAGTRPDPVQAAAVQQSLSQRALPSHDRDPSGPAARRWRSTELFGPAQEIEIEHGQAVYRLRLTSLGKLILTK